mgnify:CR=1 FL=1
MRIVGKEGNAMIVEYSEGGVIRRCLLPKETIRAYGRSIPRDILSRGIEIGIDVEEAFDRITVPTSTEILNGVREQGFWTRDDVLGNVSRFRLAIASAIAEQVSQILRGVRENA